MSRNDLTEIKRELENSFTKQFKELKDTLKQGIENKTTSYLTRKETAKLLRVNLTTLHQWKNKGILTPKGIGRRVLYDVQDINNAIVTLKN